MKPHEIIHKSHPRRLLFLMLGVFIVFTVLSALYIYFELNRPLSTHYSAIVSILSDIHETLIIKTIKINAVFFLLIFAGVLMLGIFYTHRIVGPLERVKICSRSVARGDLESKIIFRKKDMIHSFGDTFNEMTEYYSDKVMAVDSEMRQMEKILTDLKSLIEEGSATEEDMQGAFEANEKIRGLLNTIKL